MTFNIFTAGTKAKASEVNANFNSLTKLHGEIVANDVTATESQILASSSLKIVDKFLDSNGQNNTYGIIWDVGSAVYTQSFDVSAKETAPTGLTFKPDGSQMYIIGTGSKAVHNYTLSTAWDISTASFTRSFSVADKDTAPQDVVFKPDGLQMYILGFTSDKVHQYTLSTAWDISTASFTRSVGWAPQNEGAPTGLTFNTDGTKMYISGQEYDKIYQLALSTGWDISTATNLQQLIISAKEASVSGVTFKPDGSQMYIIGIGSDAVHNYTLSTAWDISTASFTRSFSVADKDTGSNGVTFKTDGTTMYMIGSTGDLVYQYDLGTSTVAYEATNKYVYCSGTTYTDSILVSHATTIPASQTKVFCVPLMYEALTGSDNITFDVSINGGTNYTTGIAKNTWSAITSTTGTSLVVKMNLDTASGASTPKVSGWAIFTE